MKAICITALATMMIFASGCVPSKERIIQRAKSHELLRALAKEIDGSGVDNVRLLISEGADVNYRGNQNWTPVLIASRYSYPEIVELLLEEGAEVNVSNNFGMTPLMFAAKYSSTPEIVQMLLEKGAEVNVRSPDGMTPLKFAKTPEIKQLLIDAGATE